VLAVECRTDDPVTAAQIGILDHAPTRLAATAERGFRAALGGGCSAPVGALAELTTQAGAGPVVQLSGVIAAPDGSALIQGRITGPAGDAEAAGDAAAVGRRLALRLLRDGGAALLGRTGALVPQPAR
jgi:hydroxymethylbilane synthase